MTDSFQTAQEQRPANLAALRQWLNELAVSPKSPASTTKPIAAQSPVLVVKGT